MTSSILRIANVIARYAMDGQYRLTTTETDEPQLTMDEAFSLIFDLGRAFEVLDERNRIDTPF